MISPMSGSIQKFLSYAHIQSSPSSRNQTYGTVRPRARTTSIDAKELALSFKKKAKTHANASRLSSKGTCEPAAIFTTSFEILSKVSNRALVAAI